MNKFWDYFNNTAAPRIQHRAVSFRAMFEHLDQIKGPVLIVETGCARQVDNYAGDGQSTIIFDRYVTERNDGSEVLTVDINPQATAYCIDRVTDRVTVTTSDSVGYLNTLANTLTRKIDLLYLDSYDVDFEYWFPSAAHHLKELTAITRAVDKNTLVVVDDCPPVATVAPGADPGQTQIYNVRVGGKGRLVAEYAQAVGAELQFSFYQAGWKGFNL